MKKVLITGKNSYIGTSLEKWLMKTPGEYQVESIDMRGDSWQSKDFSKFDVVFHVAGIAHIKETKDNKDLYYKVNKDLVYETAKKSKDDGVNQFIFLSSMSVYGVENGVIKRNTKPKPLGSYGKSKLEAEEMISALEDTVFKIAILRPPMIYGKGCKGNYSKLSKLAKKTPVFPNVNNIRSMIYIDNLSEFVKCIIDDENRGLFFPQNKEYVNTSELVSFISSANEKTLFKLKIYAPILKVFKSEIFNKVFGDLVYDLDMSKYDKDYRIYKLKESVYNTEGRDLK
ncbi:MAG: NAD-dependent epimerase/dehydratase family protein [Alkalibacterium sp.]|nr:NAD-dependent epimerase/dehydratase family protein [Alkalibacterium sp.]